jgi:hypothetical protein
VKKGVISRIPPAMNTEGLSGSLLISCNIFPPFFQNEAASHLLATIFSQLLSKQPMPQIEEHNERMAAGIGEIGAEFLSTMGNTSKEN